MSMRTPSDHNDPADTATSFESLVLNFQVPLVRYLTGMVGDPELARDLTQETFLAAYRALPTTEVSNLSAWLYRIATNQALAYLRRVKHRGTVSLAALAEPYAPGAAARDESEPLNLATRLAIEAILWELAPKDRACLLLKAVGFSSAEIARQLDCSPEAARARLARARESFRRRYHGDESDTPHRSERSS